MEISMFSSCFIASFASPNEENLFFFRGANLPMSCRRTSQSDGEKLRLGRWQDEKYNGLKKDCFIDERGQQMGL